jgi:two-component system phosphate regulon response regulator OmpR
MVADRPHILVVDDDTRLRELLRKYLTENGFRVTTAADAADARGRLAGLIFDLIVLDVMMPGESGFELTQSLRRVNPVPILLLTAMSEPEDRIAGLERGADDYLSKPFEPRELVLRIHSVLRRAGMRRREPELRLGEVVFEPARGELRRAGQPVHLTTAEASLLGVFARSPNMVLSRDDLMAEAGLIGNVRTVDVQVTRLRRKIEPDSRQPRYLHTVRGRGYVLRPN